MNRERCFPNMYLTHWTTSESQHNATRDSLGKEVIKMTKDKLKLGYRNWKVKRRERPAHQLCVAFLTLSMACSLGKGSSIWHFTLVALISRFASFDCSNCALFAAIKDLLNAALPSHNCPHCKLVCSIVFRFSNLLIKTAAWAFP